jgi:hypothetical protein
VISLKGRRFGMYCLTRPLPLSFEPCSQAELG